MFSSFNFDVGYGDILEDVSKTKMLECFLELRSDDRTSFTFTVVREEYLDPCSFVSALISPAGCSEFWGLTIDIPAIEDFCGPFGSLVAQVV